MRVADLTEEELLAQIIPRLPLGKDAIVGPGDDAAVIRAADGRFVVSTDVLVEGRHFRREWSTGADVGWRAAMQNLADVAAMGARPTAIVVALVLPADVEVAWVLDFADGLAAACGPHGVGVVGGDLSSGDAVVVSVTVHGDLGGANPVLRSGARAGDVLAHSGVLGHAAAGLGLLQGGVTDPTHPGLIEAFLRPNPPLLDGPAAARAGASAMMDVSDGLLRDAGRLAKASGVRLDLSERALGPAVDALAAAAEACSASPLAWVLTGGEDHGLLATFGPGVAVPPGFRVIGSVQAADGGPRLTLDGSPPPVAGSGWDHFAGNAN